MSSSLPTQPKAHSAADLPTHQRASQRSPFQVGWKHVGFLALLFSSLALAALTFVIDPLMVLAVVLGVMAAVVTVFYPVAGLLVFQIMTYIRPGDFSPALAALPLAKVIGGGTLVVVLIRGAISKSFVYRNRQTLLLFLFMGTLFLSVPMSFWPGKSLEVAFDFIKIIIFFMLYINLVKDLKMLRAISLITLLCICVLAVSSITASFSSSMRVGTSIGSGLFGDANDAAQIFVASIPLIALWRLGKLRGLVSNVLQGASLVILMTATVTTQSRGGFLGLLAVIMTHFVRGKNFIKGIVVVGALGGALLLLAPSSITSRYETIQTYEEDASAMSRIYTWHAGANMLISRPLTGVGAGAFEVAFGTAYKPAGYYGNKWNAPHNTLVQVGGETGFPGLIVFVLLVGYTIVQLRQMKPNGTPEQQGMIETLCHVYFASFIGWSVCAVFLTQAFSPYLYFLVASSVVLNRINGQLAVSNETPPEGAEAA